jgi:UrcA family protein
LNRFIFCAVSLALAIPAVSQAAPAASADGQPVALSVRHDDIDLSTAKGARLMINRLDEAASAVCGGASYAQREYKQALHSTACYKDSMNRAVAALGSPTVNALYNQRNVTVASK